MKKKGTVSLKNVDFYPKIMEEVDFEDALDMAGMGRYQLQHCALMLATLSTALLEMIGNAFILPAAACDLHLPDHLKGVVTSIPNIGIILTAPIWGRAADSLGRKPALQLSTAAAGLLGLAAAFMPSLLGYALCKLGASLFLSCPSSLGFAFAGELVPQRRRDKTLLLINGLMVLSTTLSPVLAWFVLSTVPSFQVGPVTVLPWRVLTAVYAAPLILTSWWMTSALESPKFLMTKKKPHLALECLKRIFATNTAMFPEDFPVTRLRRQQDEGPATAATGLISKARRDSLLRPPHLKWLALTGFLMFGLFTVLNGLFMFAPDVINRASAGPSEVSGTICSLLAQDEKSPAPPCPSWVSRGTFVLMAATTAVYGLLVVAVSTSALTKRHQVIGMFTTVAVTCLVAGLSTNSMVQGVAMSALQLSSLGVGALAAYAVRLFPTTLRGTAVGAVLMCGRAGSVAGANAAGYFLAVACAHTFYGFTALLCVCAALSFLLPKDEPTKPSEHIEMQ